MSARSGWAMLIAAALLCIPMQGPAVTFTDWWVMAVTKLALLAEPAVVGIEVSAIEVDAREGVVTLQGRVASDEARAAAGTVAGRIASVATVNNELRVDDADVPPASRPSDGALRAVVTRALRRDSRLERAPISVSVDDGIVRLTGAVPTAWDRVHASEVARAVAGVVAVQNDAAP